MTDWLTPDAVRSWLKVTEDDGADVLESIELARTAAAGYCELQRPDLVDSTGTFVASPTIVMAGLIAAARLYARKGSPAGLASYGEFGATEVLRVDPDVDRLLAVGRYARPAVG